MFKSRPSLIIVVSFLLVILVGGILLSLPLASAAGTPTNLLNAFFTANSATCVTGLVVLDTGTHFSLFGLLVILALIQVGGLGYMTFSIFMVLIFRNKLLISQKLALQEALNLYSTKDVLTVLRKIFGIVLVIEGLGALVLFLHWLPALGHKQALLYGIFHSVSAFNNAGFALPAHYANLLPYATDWVVNLTITSLVIIGGLGFMIIAEVLDRKRFSLHARVTLLTTACLLVIGTLAILALEYHNPNTLGPMQIHHKTLAAYFQAVTPRTAGFNTIDLGGITRSTGLFLMFLMFVGASPGGTGGGVKTTTFALIISTIWATLRGSHHTIIFNRRLPADTIRRAFAVALLSLAVIAAAIFCLNATEEFGLLEESFEVFSAFGTVGLSLGITPSLSWAGKLIIMAVMFIGRVGPLTLLLSLFINQHESRIRPPKEGVSIG